MTACARCTSSPTLTILGSAVRSTSVTSCGRSSAPKRSACVRMSSISCGPWMPSGNPGKFSTSVVVISAPPNCEPSNTRGCRLARAAYVAAVYPAGPDPMMIRSRMPSCSAGGIAGFPLVVTAGPGVGWELVTGGTTRIVGAAFHGRRGATPLGSGGGADDDLGEVGLSAVLDGHQTGDPDEHVPGGGRLLEGQLGGALQLPGGGDGEAVQRTVGSAPGPDLDRGPREGRAEADRRDRLLAAQVVDDADARLEAAEVGAAEVAVGRPVGGGVAVVGQRHVVRVVRVAVAERVVHRGPGDGDRGP